MTRYGSVQNVDYAPLNFNRCTLVVTLCQHWCIKMGTKSELDTFDGRDNRKEIMTLLLRLGSDRRRAVFIESLIPTSLKGFAGCRMKVVGNCGPVAAYFMMVSVCNELGVSINVAARKLEAIVKSGGVTR